MSRRFVASALLLLRGPRLGSGPGGQEVRLDPGVRGRGGEPARAHGDGLRRRGRAADYRVLVTAVGTVLATRSVTLRNELAGTARRGARPRAIVDAGTVLVALDVSVERAELQAQKARAALAETCSSATSRRARPRRLRRGGGPRPRRERRGPGRGGAHGGDHRQDDHRPFRARVGLADVHPGQYLNEGTVLTTLQGIDDVAHVDFAVPQRIAAGLRAGDRVDISEERRPVTPGRWSPWTPADATTRNATVRARIEDAHGPARRLRPGCRPDGPGGTAVAIPVSALRKGPDGDHVFVVSAGEDQKPRAHVRPGGERHRARGRGADRLRPGGRGEGGHLRLLQAP